MNVFVSSAAPWQNGVACTNLLIPPQIVWNNIQYAAGYVIPKVISLKNIDSSWNSFSQFSWNLTKSKSIKQVWGSKRMWCWEYSAVLESIAKFEQTYIKISKYGNSVFPYSLHSPANLPAWRPKDRNVALMSFLRLFTETITPQRKSFFSKLHDKYCQNWQNSWRIVNTTFCDVITKIGTFLFVTSV